MFDDCYSLISCGALKIKGIDQSGNIVYEEIPKLSTVPEVKIEMGTVNIDIDKLRESVGLATKKANKVRKSFPDIKHISYCDKPGKEKVVVVFNDNTKVIKRPVDGDVFDINIGVALAIAEKIYGSKSQFHKEIKRKTVVKKEK